MFEFIAGGLLFGFGFIFGIALFGSRNSEAVKQGHASYISDKDGTLGLNGTLRAVSRNYA